MTIEQHQAPEAGAFDPRDQQMLSYLGLNPDRPADRAAVQVARHYDLDPLLKHVVVIPKGGVYITRDGLLDIAHRSGQLDGIVVDQEPTLDRDTGEWVCRVTVYRKDMGHGFTYPGRYAANGSNRTYAPEMALKAAEAHALRRAFRVTGLPAEDEIRAAAPRPQTGGLATVVAEQQATPTTSGEEVDPGATPVAGGEAGSTPAGHTSSPLLNTSSSLANRMYAAIREAGIPEDTRLDFVAEVVGRDITSTKEITEAEAHAVIGHLPDQPDGSTQEPQ